jgi:hypothetical protein
MKLFLSILLLAWPAMVFTQVKESWIDKPLAEWPKIALINHVQFKNGDRYVDPSFKYAGTGFLINNGKDTLAATSKHILWIAKNKSSKATEINTALKRWVMIPKGNYQDSAIIDKLLNEDAAEQLEGNGSTILERDWLLFSLKSASPNLYPLKPRYTPVRPGEKVFILSSAYDDSLSTVHEGKVYKKLGMDILISRDMVTHKGGSSGSPVIDANGYLIGIVSSSAGSPAGNVTVAISTEYLQDILNEKPGLNAPKKDYGEIIYNTVLNSGTSKAIQLYRSLIKDPTNYYTYNLRSANRNGLRETAEKLMASGRNADAVAILKINNKTTGVFFADYNLLAKAQLAVGNKSGAIRSYKASIKLNNDKGNEAFEALQKLLGKF